MHYLQLFQLTMYIIATETIKATMYVNFYVENVANI
jgi:hypothetical protein